jgi:hypothetical protein
MSVREQGDLFMLMMMPLLFGPLSKIRALDQLRELVAEDPSLTLVCWRGLTIRTSKVECISS